MICRWYHLRNVLYRVKIITCFYLFLNIWTLQVIQGSKQTQKWEFYCGIPVSLEKEVDARPFTNTDPDFSTHKRSVRLFAFIKKRGGGGCPMHDNFGNIALKFIDVPTERIQSSWLLSSPPPHPQSSRILNISGKCHWISTNIEKIAEKLHQNCQLFMPRFFG